MGPAIPKGGAVQIRNSGSESSLEPRHVASLNVRASVTQICLGRMAEDKITAVAD
jgi:hypothetical protein